jgi:thiol-disulfide isomerase/thioredoxin
VNRALKFLARTKISSAFLLVPAFVLVFFAGTALAQKGRSKSSAKGSVAAQTVDPNLPKVTQIDEASFGGLIKKSTTASRPVLVNFWATWCDPCREEFPELVKIDSDYGTRGLDFMVISMDDLVDMTTTVPQFLAGVKAKMPAYLLIAKDEGAFLESITAVGNKEDAVVGLPVTILFDATGKIAYKKSGKIKPEVLRAEIDKLIPPAAAPPSAAK